MTSKWHWRSREKWVSSGTPTGWVHKHPYPHFLNLKAVFPQSQTVSISPPAGAAAAFAVPLRKGTLQPTHPCAQPASRPQIAHETGVDVEHHVVAPKMSKS